MKKPSIIDVYFKRKNVQNLETAIQTTIPNCWKIRRWILGMAPKCESKKINITHIIVSC